MSRNKDSVKNVLFVSVALCVVCSVIVSAIAVGLRDRQEANAARDKKKNVLLAAGIIDESFAGDLAEKFARFEAVFIDLASGKPVDGDAAGFDMGKVMNVPAAVDPITPDQYPLGIKKRPKQVTVFIEKIDGKLSTVVLPVVGQGLWSTMFGFLALSADLKTPKGLVFYQQGETAGLGGEVDNPRWRNQFRLDKKKSFFDESGNYEFTIVKGPRAEPGNPHQADGISGATITCRGVDGMLRYWLSDAAYGPFLKWLKDERN